MDDKIKIQKRENQGKEIQNRILFSWETDEAGKKYLIPKETAGRLDGKQLQVTIQERSAEGLSSRNFPVFEQKAGTYGKYSEYMTRHGCACCSLTTLLAAYVPQYCFLRPDQTIAEIEHKYFPEKIWKKNYGKHIARQMPVSLYGISQILKIHRISHQYVGDFEDKAAENQIRSHLLSGRTAVIETSRMKRKNGKIEKWFDKRFAGSYHTMVLLGIDKDNQVIFTDSAFRGWSGERQRLKWAELSDLLAYMFPQKNTGDRHVYFSRRKNTGGYILIGV